MLIKIGMSKECYLKYIESGDIEEIDDKKAVLVGYSNGEIDDRYFWEVKRVGNDIVFVRRKSNIEHDIESGLFSVFEVKAVVDVENVLSVKTKAVINIDNEEVECEVNLVRDDVTGSYIVNVTIPGIVEDEHIQLPEEMGVIFDSIENPVELVSLIESVLTSEGFWKYILKQLEV